MRRNQKAALAVATALGVGFLLFRPKEASAAQTLEPEDIEPDIDVEPDEAPEDIPEPQGPPVTTIPPTAERSPGLPPITQDADAVVDDEEPSDTPQPTRADPEVIDQLRRTAEQVAPGITGTLDRVLSGGVAQQPSDDPKVLQPTAIPEDTLALLRIMLPKESGSSWKVKEPKLVPWQRARGLKDDGLFGKKSAVRMAEETGLLPIIRFWPRGTTRTSGALEDYKADLLAAASRFGAMAGHEAHAAQLRAAVDREQGQAYSRVIRPIGVRISV
jgi:hypothetical protein